MTLVAFGSLKGSPGVTTAALALAAGWDPGRAVLLAECDPAGGDLAGWFTLPEQPGLVSWAAASRHAGSPSEVWEHTQPLPGGLPVLAGPASAEQARAALSVLTGGPLAALSSRTDIDVLADLGRLDRASPAKAIFELAGLLVLAVRPVLGQLHHLPAQLEALRTASRQLAVLLIGEGPYRVEEVAQTLEVEVLGQLPADPAGAALLGHAAGSARALGRSPLIRAARPLTEEIIGRLPASTSDPHPSGDPNVPMDVEQAPLSGSAGTSAVDADDRFGIEQAAAPAVASGPFPVGLRR